MKSFYNRIIAVFQELVAARGLLDDWTEAPPVLQLQHLVDTFKLWWGQDLRGRPFGALLRVLDDWRADVEQLQGEGVPSPPMGGSIMPFEYSPDSHSDDGISASLRDHFLEHGFGGAGSFAASLDREMKGKVQNVLSSEMNKSRTWSGDNGGVENWSERTTRFGCILRDILTSLERKS